MKTFAQSWAERLKDLRDRCHENGERLDAELREWYRRQHVGAWWSTFCEAAEVGADIPAIVWSSAERLGANRMPGYVPRLRVRNRARRDHLKLP